MSEPTAGMCRYCKCTEDDPCNLAHSDTCLLNTRTWVCTRPSCLIAEEKRLQSERSVRRPNKYAGWGYGAVLEDMRKQRRRLRRKMAKR